MHKILIFFLHCQAILAHEIESQTLSLIDNANAHWSNYSKFETVHEWRTLDYNWESAHNSTSIVNPRKGFIPIYCTISDMEILNGEIFVTVPRWRHGVPSSLNKVIRSPRNSRKHVLNPYPNWDWNQLNNCSSIQYAHAIAIDPLMRMWIADTGRWGMYTRPNNRCPAKLIVWDMVTMRLLRRHYFSENVVSKFRALLTDIVIDTSAKLSAEWFAYIANTGEDRLIVYSWQQDRSWTVFDESMKFDMKAIRIGTRPPVVLPMGIKSLTLSPHHFKPDRHYLFFAPLSGYYLYRIRTNILRNSSKQDTYNSVDSYRRKDPRSGTGGSIGRYIERVGARSSQSAAMTISEPGIMYYSVLEANSINIWNISLPFSALNVTARDSRKLQWVGSFAWHEGFLYFVSNRLQHYTRHSLNKNEINLRIMRMRVGAFGYMGRVGGAPIQQDLQPLIVVVLSAPTMWYLGARV